MKRDSIRSHLNPYSIYRKRKTTVNHAFASAIAVNDEYDDKLLIEALSFLGLNPDEDLICVYCLIKPAETWDHVFGLVKDQQYAGYGHTIGNLLPCCKDCNSRKGNKHWRNFLPTVLKNDELTRRIKQLDAYFDKYLDPPLTSVDITQICSTEMEELSNIRDQVLTLLKTADKVAAMVRVKVRKHMNELAEQEQK